MINRFKCIFAICLLAFASMQSAQAGLVYNSGTAVLPNGFVESGVFSVVAGEEYEASLLDVFDTFDVYSMAIFNEGSLVGSAYSNAGAGDDDNVLSFAFTALSDAVYSIYLGGTTSTLSTYSATVATLTTGASPVPVPGAIWFMGSAIFALVGLGRRKVA